MQQQFLVHLTLPDDQQPVRERVLRTAAVFLEMVGPVERHELGRYARPAKTGAARDSFELTCFTLEPRLGDNPILLGFRLELALREAMKTIGVDERLVRVFASTGELAAR